MYKNERGYQGFRWVTAARVNHVPKRTRRNGRGGEAIGKDSGSKSGVCRPRAKQGHPRKRKKFFPLPGETPTRSSLLRLEAIRGKERKRGGEGSAPSRVPSIFPATRTGTNCDSTVATSSPSPPSFEERCCCCCRVCEEELENERN